MISHDYLEKISMRNLHRDALLDIYLELDYLESLVLQNITVDAGNFSGNSTDDSASTFNSGDTAWMLFSSVLVLLMTLPGVALLYGGLVSNRKKLVATSMQSFSITCLVTFLWLILGYSISFAPVLTVDNALIYGDLSRVWFKGMTVDSYHQLASTIPESVYCTFQLTFAIITPALICGSFVERMKFSSLLLFIGLWHLCVYCPIAHANWHPGGFLFQAGVLDFAGGNVVHTSSGMTALVASLVVRNNFKKEVVKPNDLMLTFMGAAFLWIGWFGFNAGSAGAANQRAAMAMIATHIATACSVLSTIVTCKLHQGEINYADAIGSVVSGLVAITPAAGYVDPSGAFVIGVVAGPVCYFGCRIKDVCNFDDSLDAFGVHAIGGMLGGILTGVFAKNEICGVDGAIYGRGRQLLIQLYGIGFTVGWTVIVSFIILKFLDLTIGLKGQVKMNNIGSNALSMRKINKGINISKSAKKKSIRLFLPNIAKIASEDEFTNNNNMMMMHRTNSNKDDDNNPSQNFIRQFSSNNLESSNEMKYNVT